jgi:ferritin-like metal-binding protein YciE
LFASKHLNKKIVIMKQSTTKNATRGRKPAASSNSASKNKTTGGRQSSSNSRQGGSNNSRESADTSRQGSSNSSSQGSSGRQGSSSRQNSSADNSTRGNTNTSDRSRKTSSSQKGADRQNSFEGESHLEKFFLDQLQDIYYAEQKILQSLPKMKDAATTEELKDAFDDHLHQTQRHVKRLEKVFETLNQSAEGKKCEAIEGIAREVENIISETEQGTMTRDAALIIAAQKVEHYEIATYGGLVQLAITMQLHDAADLLDKTLVEEEDTDARLTEIAENDINLGAEHEGNQHGQSQGSEEDEEEDVDEESPNI